MNTNNGVKRKRVIVTTKVEQINEHLFIDKSNNIKIGMNDMTVNDSEMMCMKWKDEAYYRPIWDY